MFYLGRVRNRPAPLFVFLSLLPLLWVFPGTAPDWGGDWAAYVHQAQNILSGDSPEATGYIYNPEYFRLAPPSYPSGFPMVLSAWISIFGSSMAGFIHLMSVFALFFGWGFYRISARRVSHGAAWAMTLITVYNPWMIRFQGEIIADLPFATWVVWSVFFYHRARRSRKTRRWILTSLAIIMAILTKSIGWVLPIAVVLDQIVLWWKTKEADPWIAMGATTLTTFLGVQLVEKIWLPTESQHLEHFTRIASDRSDLMSVITDNIEGYMNIYEAFFIVDVGDFTFIAATVGAFLMVFAWIGAITRWIKRGLEWDDWVFLGLMAGLLAFPITNGFRYLLPAFVFIFGYSAYGLGRLPWPFLLRPWVPALSAILLFALYTNGWSKIQDVPRIPEGPFAHHYEGLMELVSEETTRDPELVIVAAKPRVWSHLFHVNAFAVHPDATSKEAEQQMDRLRENRHALIIRVQSTPHPSTDRFTPSEGKWSVQHWPIPVSLPDTTAETDTISAVGVN